MRYRKECCRTSRRSRVPSHVVFVVPVSPLASLTVSSRHSSPPPSLPLPVPSFVPVCTARAPAWRETSSPSSTPVPSPWPQRRGAPYSLSLPPSSVPLPGPTGRNSIRYSLPLSYSPSLATRTLVYGLPLSPSSPPCSTSRAPDFALFAPLRSISFPSSSVSPFELVPLQTNSLVDSLTL